MEEKLECVGIEFRTFSCQANAYIFELFIQVYTYCAFIDKLYFVCTRKKNAKIRNIQDILKNIKIEIINNNNIVKDFLLNIVKT